MTDFATFLRDAPAVAEPIQAKLAATGIGLLGTLRADGWPRISPVELSFQEGELIIGMMPGSRKARDLQRDVRCSLLTPVANKDDLGGEGKLFGTATEVTDPERCRALLGAALAGAGYDVDLDAFEGSHVFSVAVTSAAWQLVQDDDWTTLSWKEGGPVRTRRRSGPGGDVVDLVDGH